MRLSAAITTLSLIVLFSLAASAQRKPGVSRYTLPGKTGALEISLGEFKVERTELSSDGPKIGMSAAGERGLLLSLFVKPAEKPGPATVCRDTWWPHTESSITGELKATLQEKRLYQKGQMAMVEYFVPKFASEVINQRTIHAYLTSGGLWIEIQISKKQYRPQDRALFDRVLNTVVTLPTYVNTSRDYAGFGGYFFAKNNYADAARYYQQALDMETKAPALDKTSYEIMVDELAASYLASHDLQNARAALQHGIARYPGYPLFYYSMAAVFAELDRMDDCIAQLRAAYQRKDGIIAGEGFPNPSTDEYFRKYLKEEKFKKALREMQQ